MPPPPRLNLRSCNDIEQELPIPKMQKSMEPSHLYDSLVRLADAWEKCEASLVSLFAKDLNTDPSCTNWVGIGSLLCLQRAHDWMDEQTAEFARQHSEIPDAISAPCIPASLIAAWRERLQEDSLDARIVDLVQTEALALAMSAMQNRIEKDECGYVADVEDAEPDMAGSPSADESGPSPAPSPVLQAEEPAHEPNSVQAELVSDELEELILEPEAEDASLRPGTVHMIGETHYVVEQCLPRGYYRGREENGDDAQSVLFHPSPGVHHALWLQMNPAPSHPRLPEILYKGEDGLILEIVEGEPLQPGLTLQEAVEHLHGVVQLMRFLATQNAVVTDIDLAGCLMTDSMGLRLQFLPTISPMGAPAQVCFGDGVTPLPGSETACATEATSVFLWGAMLYMLVTGDSLSPEGLPMLLLSQLREPGLPQLLSLSLLHRDQCPNLRTLMEHYRPFRVPPVPRYRIGAASTVGLNPTRLCNEDSYGFVYDHREYHAEHMQSLRACVADGMGGEEAGEVASRAGVHAFCRHLPPPRLDQPDIQAAWTRELGWMANEAVMDALENSGGGCTLTGIVVMGNRLTLAHVGDSRAYLYSQAHGLAALSRDHSLVQAMVESGNMTEDEAADSPDINQVTRALGTARRTGLHTEYVDSLSSLVDAEGSSVRGEWLDLNVGDLILLMSDGIWGAWEYRETVISAELHKVIVEANCHPQAIADMLIECALEAGADDNATIVVVKRVQ